MRMKISPVFSLIVFSICLVINTGEIFQSLLISPVFKLQLIGKKDEEDIDQSLPFKLNAKHSTVSIDVYRKQKIHLI